MVVGQTRLPQLVGGEGVGDVSCREAALSVRGVVVNDTGPKCSKIRREESDWSSNSRGGTQGALCVFRRFGVIALLTEGRV